ncbi:Ig-like domain-containing protein [Methanoculleus bourgensis]|uniref:PKD domain-containing protein n=1 Tax=Methanoculleus bourgensis TaxID=83986 RepID=A0A0X3BPR1_9EURY
MRKTLSIYSILLIIALISAGVGAVGAVSAKDATVGTVTNVPNGTVIPVNITIHSANKMDAFGFHVEFDPDVIKVTRSLKRVDGWSITGSLEDPGKYKIGGYSEEPDAVLTGDFLLCDLMCQALTNDGSKTNITLVFDTIYEQKKNVAQDYKSVNGTFSTLDEVPPTITIDYPRDTATVSQDIMVNATITDVGGVNPDSIKVYVGNTAVTFDKKAISQDYYIVNATHTVQNLGQYVICVEASDNSSPPISNNSSITVNVQQSGITITYPKSDGQFINTSRPAISADFVEVYPNTVRMFLDGKNVTDNCTIDTGTITLGYGTDHLNDKKYEVVVSGTSSLTNSSVSRNANFTIDTTPPIVSIDRIDDSDDDGFPEADEQLYVHYTANDPYLKEVWFGGECSTSSSGIIEVEVPVGTWKWSPTQLIVPATSAIVRRSTSTTTTLCTSTTHRSDPLPALI